MNWLVRVPGERRRVTRSPADKLCLAVPSAPRSIVSVSPARAVRETISRPDPDALLRVSSAFFPAGGEGKRLPSPAATVRLAPESARFAASVDDAA